MTSELHTIVENAIDLAPTTRSKYLRDLNAWIQFAGTDPRGWTQPKAQAFYNALISERKLRPQSAARLFASLAYAAKWWAVGRGDTRLDFTNIRTVKGNRDKIEKRSLTVEHAITMLSVCGTDPHGLRDFALLVVGLETGMRRMSLAAMNFAHLVDEPGNVRVPIKGSNGELRDVALTPTAILALRPWREWLNNPKRGFVFCGLRQAVLGNNPARTWRPIKDTPVTGSAIQKIVGKRAEEAAIGHVHPHILRHTFVTWRMNAGYSPADVASVTGHTLPAMGALSHYIDMKAIAPKMRDSTPTWLAELVRKRVEG